MISRSYPGIIDEQEETEETKTFVSPPFAPSWRKHETQLISTKGSLEALLLAHRSRIAQRLGFSWQAPIVDPVAPCFF